MCLCFKTNKFILIPTRKNNYLYDALGQKVRKVITDNPQITTTDYQGIFHYENEVLNFFATAEGYAGFSTRGFYYVYNYTDHLGNIRLSYTKNTLAGNPPVIVEENNYSPFGLKHQGYNNISPPNNVYQYKYNGKEFQDELGLNFYDYGARNYDPAIGGWMNIDPLAESYYSHTPYSYCMNNPVYFIDIDGRKWASKKDEEQADEMMVKAELKARQAEYENFVARNDLAVAKEMGNIQMIEKASSKIYENSEIVKEMRSIIKDILFLGDHELYSFSFQATQNGNFHLHIEEGNKIVIEYEKDRFGIKYHETKHAAQYARGMEGMMFNSNGRMVYTNKILGAKYELESYRVQYSYNKNDMPSSDIKLNSIKSIDYEWLGSIRSDNPNNTYPYKILSKAAMNAEKNDNKKRGGK